MSNKEKKKRKKGHVPSSEPSSPFSFEFIFPLPFDSSSFPTIFVHHFSLSLSLLSPHPPLSFSSSKISAGLSRRLKGGSRIYLAGNTISSIYSGLPAHVFYVDR